MGLVKGAKKKEKLTKKEVEDGPAVSALGVQSRKLSNVLKGQSSDG
jgi:hypothetical protein